MHMMLKYLNLCPKHREEFHQQEAEQILLDRAINNEEQWVKAIQGKR